MKMKTKVLRGREGWYSLLVEEQKKRSVLYEDLTKDKDRLQALSNAVNKNDVSRSHLEDIIEDFLD